MQTFADFIAIWNDYIDANRPSFVSMVQVFTEKAVTSLKTNIVVAHPVNVLWLGFTKAFQCFLIEYGYTLARLLLVCTTTNEQNEHAEKITNSK